MHPRGAKAIMPYFAAVPSLCLLVEADGQLVMVDAGIGLEDAAEPRRLGHANLLLRASRDPAGTAASQLAGMGLRPEDVAHIICTHLDRDHAGGLPDFPQARVHVWRAEWETALHPPSFPEKDRYRPPHFAHGPDWVLHDSVSPKKWFGLDCVRELPGLGSRFLLIPLPGHTRGHCGVALQTEEGWLLHCGDACYVAEELSARPRLPLGLRVFRRMAHVQYSQAMAQLDRLRSALRAGGGEISSLASHDAAAWTRLCPGTPLHRTA